MEHHKFGEASTKNWLEAKPDLRKVVKLALLYSEIDFSVVDGRRTIEEQRKNIENGVSWSIDTRHFPDPEDNLCYALDIYPWYNGKTDHSQWLYDKIAKAMFRAAIELGIDIEWGGFWKEDQKDCPHWQLSERKYPKPTHKDTYWNLINNKD